MQEVQIYLPVGSVLRDRYVVETLLGQGGFGAVYRVRDQRVKGNVYALKEVIEPKRKDRAGKEKNHFHFESDLLKQLDHRALPRVYRVFDDEVQGRAYMLMDFIDGPNLEVLRKQRPAMRFSLSQVLILMEPIVDAISYLHGQQPPIVHRDIKPSNIIVPAPQEAVLVDFDIAKEFDPDSTTTAVRRCSPGYGAPEQYGHGTSPLTDIYGLGATIYTLLSGQIPPDALYRMTLLGGKGRDPLVPLDELMPNISQKVAQAVQRSMSLQQSDRFTSVEHFWREIDTNATSLEVPVPSLPAQSLPVPSSASAHPVLHETVDVEITKKRPVTLLPLAGELSTDPLSNGTKRKGRKKSALLLVLLALAICCGGVVGFWSLTDHPEKGFIQKITPTFGSQATSIPTVPAAVPTGTGIAGRNIPTATAIVPSLPHTTPVANHPNPTPIATQPTVPPLTPTSTPRPTPTPVPDPYPTLAGGYHGTIIDTTPSPNITTRMYLTAIKQNKGSISGNFSVDAPLQGNGPFSGSVGTNKYIQFTVKGYNGAAPLYFWGFVQSNASLQGQYCSLDANGHCSANVGAGGYWNVG